MSTHVLCTMIMLNYFIYQTSECHAQIIVVDVESVIIHWMHHFANVAIQLILLKTAETLHRDVIWRIKFFSVVSVKLMLLIATKTINVQEEQTLNVQEV